MSTKYGSSTQSSEETERRLEPAHFDTQQHFLTPRGVDTSRHHFTNWFLKYLKGGSLRERHVLALQKRKPRPEKMPSDVLEVHAESVRQIAYILFWMMVVFAHVFSFLFVPKDTIDHSVLKDMFGYNNICVYWDYSPSREFTAMIYPAFEYSFFLYIVFDLIHLRLSCKTEKFKAANWLYWVVSRITFPLKLVLIALFRMIFVYTVSL